MLRQLHSTQRTVSDCMASRGSQPDVAMHNALSVQISQTSCRVQCDLQSYRTISSRKRMAHTCLCECFQVAERSAAEQLLFQQHIRQAAVRGVLADQTEMVATHHQQTYN